MPKPRFYSWYYNNAVHNLLEIWKNYLVFGVRIFSIWELLKTLFSPWRRDVSLRTWRGWNPAKSLELLSENLFSRLIGAIVRSVVIVAALVFLCLVFVIGLLSLLAWIGSLPMLVALIYSALAHSEFLLSAGSLSAAWVASAITLYFYDTNSDVQYEDDLISKSPAFGRIAGRLGISKKRFPVEILENKKLFSDFLKTLNLTEQDYQNICEWELERFAQHALAQKFWRQENLMKKIPIGLHWRYGYTVHLDRYGTDLSQHDYSEYAHLKLFGRIEEFEVLSLILQRPDQNCALVVGPSGVGKKTLIHELARRIRHGQYQNYFESMRLIELDLGRAISDAINNGEDVENFLRSMFYEAAFAGNVVLIIENIQHFLGNSGNVFHPDISVVLSEVLHLPSFQIIGTSTSNEYHQLIEKQEQLVKYFEVIEMREPEEEDARAALLNALEKYEKHRVLFTYSGLNAVIRDSSRHNWQVPLPERAIDLAMDVLMFWEKNSNDEFITEKTVDAYLSLKTGVPHGEVTGSERKKLLNLEQELHRHVIGQEEAVRQVSEALRRARSGIGNSAKPVGSFLFLGPTGVGKTETAKALAKTYFGDEKHLLRLDMSEFQSPNSIDRLLGSSQLNQVGRLVNQIKDNPYCVLLLDEIEKAYPEILDIFLQILDEGFVTDAFGEKINFRNSIIVATSNAGAALIKDLVDENKPADEIKQAVIDYAIENNIFRVEFLNRFEGVIFFRPLEGDELISVAQLQLKKFARRLAKEKNIHVEFGDDVVDQVIEKGYNPMFGARSLNRYIEDSVEDLVARKIIAGEVAQGEKIHITL